VQFLAGEKAELAAATTAAAARPHAARSRQARRRATGTGTPAAELLSMTKAARTVR
jgi:hypothetical protein